MSNRYTRKNIPNVRKSNYTQYSTVKPKYTYNDEQLFDKVGHDQLGLTHPETHYYSIIIAMIDNAYTYRDYSYNYKYRVPPSNYPNYLLPHILPYTAYDVIRYIRYIKYIKRVGIKTPNFLNSITNYILSNHSPISMSFKNDLKIHQKAIKIGLFAK